MAKALFLEDLPIIGKYVRDLLTNKVDKVEGKSLSTNDYTTEEKTKLEELSNDYDDLTDKPSINGVTLSGNKTTEDLIPIGDGLNFNTDGELEATSGSDVLVIEAVIYNETPELYSIRFEKSLTEIVSDIEGVNGNAIVKIWTTSSKLTCYLSETFNHDGSGNWVTNVRRYSNNYDMVCRDVLMIGNSSDNRKSVRKYPLQKNLTFDSTPTQNSSNPVTSGGIYNAIQNIPIPEVGESAIAITNANTLGTQNKQLLKLTINRLKELNTEGTWNNNVYTKDGVTFTVYVDNKYVESIIADGTTTGSSVLVIDTIDAQPNTKYIVNGGCTDPNYEGEGQQHNFYVQVGNQYIYDEEDYEVETDSGFLSYSIYVQGTADGAEFLPMIRTVGNSNFAPYASTIDERIEVLKNADKNINDKLQGSKTAGSADGSPFEIPDYGMTESIDMYFKPTQDLHGYDKPWAGGTGKNKLDNSLWGTQIINGVTFTPQTDGTILVNGVNDGTADSIYWLIDYSAQITPQEEQILSGLPSEYSGVVYGGNNIGSSSTDVELHQGTSYSIALLVGRGESVNNVTIYPMIRKSTESADFEPYSNICPISGQNNATFKWTDKYGDINEITMDFGKICYGGFCQLNEGKVFSTWEYIPSYNGEEILFGYEWVSDRDEYAIGTTPTIGAEVAFDNPQSGEFFVVKHPINLNLDKYPIEYNGWMANVAYQPKNTVLLQAKEYTDGKLSTHKPFNYSTSEQIVGKWIDGKPLYQVTKQWQVPAETTGQWNNYSVGNLGTLDYMNISELAFDYSTSNYRFGNTVGLGTMEVASSFEKVGARLGYNTESGNVFVQLENVGTTSPLYQYGGTLTATIRYTKTVN